MDVCKYCKEYHPDWEVCDGLIEYIRENGEPINEDENA